MPESLQSNVASLRRSLMASNTFFNTDDVVRRASNIFDFVYFSSFVSKKWKLSVLRRRNRSLKQKTRMQWINLPRKSKRKWEINADFQIVCNTKQYRSYNVLTQHRAKRTIEWQMPCFGAKCQSAFQRRTTYILHTSQSVSISVSFARIHAY